ncbi:MAG: polysaccharide biosynthesis/export family protein [Cyclobacteriaceae bacterium]
MQKDFLYLQETDSGMENDVIFNVEKYEILAKVGYHINLKVKSADKSLTSEFEFDESGQDIRMLIEPDGSVEIPLVGKIYVLGLNEEAITKLIRTEVSKYIINAQVEVRLQPQGYNLIGEFKKVGPSSLREGLTVFEMIARAGGLSNVANRKELVLIRTYEEGQKIHYVDITKRDIINSDFYFVHPNDLWYAQRHDAVQFSSLKRLGQSTVTIGLGAIALFFVVSSVN